MANGGHLKIEKSWYLQNCLANFDEILHDNTYYFSRAYRLFKNHIQKFKMADGRHFEKC